MEDKKQIKAFRNFHFLIYFVVFLYIILFVYAVQSYQILSGSSVTINEHGVLKKVTNSCGPGIFVPTNTAAEWSAFRSSKPGCATVSDLASCNLPWGGTIPHGSSVTAYASSSVPCGSSCSSETRTCTDGSLSGSYANSGCSVAACASCGLPWGGTIPHGSSVTAYASSSVPCGSSCSSQTRTCNNGALLGSYQYSSCSVQSCCTPTECDAPEGGPQNSCGCNSGHDNCGGECSRCWNNCNPGQECVSGECRS